MVNNNFQIFNDFARLQMKSSSAFSAAPQPEVITKEEKDSFHSHHRHHKSEKFNPVVALGSIIGTVLPLAYMFKKQGIKLPANMASKNTGEKVKSLYKTFNKVEFEAKELISMSLGALIGGTVAGTATDKEKTPQKNKNRAKEFIFQAFNVSIPTLLAGTLIKTVENKATKNVIPLKIAATIAGVGAGMPIAAMISNKVNKTFIDPNDPGKKIHPKNYLVHADDAVGALVLAKVPFVDKLPVKAILPAIFVNCGYEAGTAKK